MLRSHRAIVRAVVLSALAAAPAGTQQFQAGAVYMQSVAFDLPPNLTYAGIRRVDPVTGTSSPFVTYGFAGGLDPGGATYDPFRDRIVTAGISPTGVFGIHAIDAAGNWTLLASPGNSVIMKRLAPRGDGKIYAYRQAAAPAMVPHIYYLDALNQEHTLLDVGGLTPWGISGSAQVFGDPIRAMIYEPHENALFIALFGDGSTPSCAGPSNFEVTLRKLPLTVDGTALRAAAICTTYDVSTQANASEDSLSFSYGPQGSLVLAVRPNWSGAAPRLLRIDPVTAQATPFAIVGPYPGDIGIECAAYCPTTGKALIVDAATDVFRAYQLGESGGGTVLASSPGAGLAGNSTLFVVGPIGPGPTLTADTFSVSTSAGGVQHLEFDPGPARAGDIYLIIGSLSGWSPGFTLGGLAVPLNFDAYTDLTITTANSPLFVNTLGTLGASGAASAQVAFPPGLLAVLQGLTLHHAAITANPSLMFTHVSNPVPLILLP